MANVIERSRKGAALGMSALLVAGLLNLGSVTARSEVRDSGTTEVAFVYPEGAPAGSVITGEVITKDIDQYLNIPTLKVVLAEIKTPRTATGSGDGGQVAQAV